MKYEIGQRVRHCKSGIIGVVAEIDTGWPQPYRVNFGVSGDSWIREDGLMPVTDVESELRAENQRLKAVLHQIANLTTPLDPDNPTWREIAQQALGLKPTAADGQKASE